MSCLTRNLVCFGQYVWRDEGGNGHIVHNHDRRDLAAQRERQHLEDTRDKHVLARLHPVPRGSIVVSNIQFKRQDILMLQDNGTDVFQMELGDIPPDIVFDIATEDAPSTSRGSEKMDANSEDR